jgi:hypothetical protein
MGSVAISRRRAPLLFAGILAASVAVAVAGCEEDENGDMACDSDELDWGRGGEFMLPGTDCIECHRPGANAPESVFTVAGTVFVAPTCPTPVEGAIIRISDARGRSAALIANEVGNFFTAADLRPPFQFSVEYGHDAARMEYAVDSGSCNRCHALDSRLGLVPPSPDR